MNVEQFLALLEAHAHQHLRIVLPNGEAVAAHFHITEVGHMAKRFMDCGGTLRQTESCLLQTWVHSDAEHRLDTTKLAHILRMAGDVLPSLDLPVEIEHEAGVVSQYPVISASSDGQTFTLTTGVDEGASFVGTEKNDTYNATPSTLTVLDSLDGGAGTDTIKVASATSITAAPPANATLKSIENFVASSLGTIGVTHTYVSRLSEGHAMLDAARVARKLPGLTAAVRLLLSRTP